MFSRCTICNIELTQVGKHQIQDKVPEYVFQTQEKFYTCKNCLRIYWAGTHWGNVSGALKELSLIGQQGLWNL